VVLLVTGWTAEAMAEVLLVDPNTVHAQFVMVKVVLRA